MCLLQQVFNLPNRGSVGYYKEELAWRRRADEKKELGEVRSRLGISVPHKKPLQ
jgi:hypothetical protein